MLVRVRDILYFSLYFIIFLSIYKTVNSEEIITKPLLISENIQTNLLKDFQQSNFNTIKKFMLKSSYSLGKKDPFTKIIKVVVKRIKINKIDWTNFEWPAKFCVDKLQE